MALSTREKIMVFGGGIALIWGAGLFLGIMPLWDSMTANWGKLATLETQIGTLDLQINGINAQIKAIKARQAAPLEDIKIRTYAGAEDEHPTIKAMVNGIMKLTEISGAKFIRLEPQKNQAPEQIIVGGNTPPAADGAAGAPPPPPPGQEGAPPAKNIVEIDTRTYEFSIRGDYHSVSKFLTGLNYLPDLLEIKFIDIVNEAGRDRMEGSKGSTVNLDPTKPIRLDAVLKFYYVKKSIFDSL